MPESFSVTTPEPVVTYLNSLWEVVEDHCLETKLLSTDDRVRQIERHKERLEDGQLWRQQ